MSAVKWGQFREGFDQSTVALGKICCFERIVAPVLQKNFVCIAPLFTGCPNKNLTVIAPTFLDLFKMLCKMRSDGKSVSLHFCDEGVKIFLSITYMHLVSDE